MLLVLASSFAALLLVAAVLLTVNSFKFRHMPGLPMPLFGDVYDILTSYSTEFDKLAKRIVDGFNKFGDLYCMWFGPFIVVCVADAILLEELCVHPHLQDKEPLIYNQMYDMFRGAFSKSRADKTWKRNRKAIQTTLSQNYLESYHSVFVRRSQELLEALEAMVSEGQFDLAPPVMLMSLDTTGETMGGYISDNLTRKTYVLYYEFQRFHTTVLDRILCLGTKRLNRPYWETFTSFCAYMHELLADVKARAQGVKPSGVTELGYMPFAETMVKELLAKGTKDDDIMPYLVEGILESFFTTGIVLSGSLLFLAMYPEHQERAYQEQKKIFGDSLAHPTVNDVRKMDFLERVIKETVRWFSLPELGRRARADIKIGNHFIPNNATVVYSFDRLRKDPRYWECPNIFHPDHFSPEAVASRPKSCYMGFGIGLRNCPGFHYGMNLVKTSLSMVIRHLKFSSPLKLEDLEFKAQMFMEIKQPYTVTVEKRSGAEAA